MVAVKATAPAAASDVRYRAYDYGPYAYRPYGAYPYPYGGYTYWYPKYPYWDSNTWNARAQSPVFCKRDTKL